VGEEAVAVGADERPRWVAALHAAAFPPAPAAPAARAAPGQPAAPAPALPAPPTAAELEEQLLGAIQVPPEALPALAAARAAAARDTVVMRRQAVDTIPDSVLNAAVALMEEAETTDAEVLLKRRLGRRDAAAAAATRRAISGVRAMTAAELRRSYTMAYAEARGRMDSTLAAAGVRALFAPERLATADSLRAGRRIVVAARNVARAYNRTEVQVERAFRDTVAYQVGRMGWSAAEQAEWGARAALKETYEGTQLTDSLLTSVDRIYGLLLTQRGRYDLGPEGILFSDPKAANEYARHAQWLAARIDRFAQVDDQARWPTARRIVAAFEGTRPPVLLQGALGS
jgi:hypothetical protein